MPARLTAPAGRLTPCTMSRQFSTTKAIKAPRYEPRAPAKTPPSSSPSSSMSILNMSSPRRTPSHKDPSSHTSPSTPSSNTPARPGEAANRLLERFRSRAEATQRSRQAQADYQREVQASSEYMRQMPRRWRKGEVYSPSDLGAVAMKKVKTKRLGNVGSPQVDVVDSLGLKPLDMYKNFSIVQHFTTRGGGVRHSQATGLSNVNQRKVARMVRRVQGMGLYPSIHAHPELLRGQFYPTR